MNIQGEWVLITGAAGGLGSAIAMEFASRGANLILTDLDVTSMETLSSDATSRGATVLCLAHDVTDRARWKAIADELSAAGRQPRVLVNNAGVAAAGSVLGLSDESWEQVINIDLWGVIHGCREFVPRMQQTPGTSGVLNVASCAGFIGLPLGSAYSIAKAGVIRLTQSLQCEIDPDSVSFTALCPGAFHTGIWASAGTLGAVLPSTMARITRASKPDKRDPSQVARRAVKGLLAGRPVVKVYSEAWILDAATRLIPAGWFAKISRRLYKRSFPNISDNAARDENLS